MSNIELIDDYLTNRLNDVDKAAFENQLASDPTLKADVELQKQIIEGVRKARAAELKAMLSQVPVAAPVSFSLPVMRMAASIVGAGIMIVAFSYYFNSNKGATNMSSSLEDSVHKVDPADFEPLEEPTANEPKAATQDTKSTPTHAKPEEKEATPPVSPVQQPKIDIVDPTKDMMEDGNSSIPRNENETTRMAISASHIAVEVDDKNKKYPFHYQFNQGKLFLYGSFDKGLYEILEINGESHSVFLFYKDRYYSLNEKASTITALEAIQNQALINKLKEYKGK